MQASIFERSVFHFTPLDVLHTYSLLTARMGPEARRGDVDKLAPSLRGALSRAASLACEPYYQHLIIRIAHGREDNFIDQLEVYNRQALCFACRSVENEQEEHAARMTVVERGLLN